MYVSYMYKLIIISFMKSLHYFELIYLLTLKLIFFTLLRIMLDIQQICVNPNIHNAIILFDNNDLKLITFTDPSIAKYEFNHEVSTCS